MCPCARRSSSRASSASQSVSCSMYLPLQHSALRQHSTPRSASPIPLPRPPRLSPYWDRHFQILDPRQCLPCGTHMRFRRCLPGGGGGWGRGSPLRMGWRGEDEPSIFGVRGSDASATWLAEPDADGLACTHRPTHEIGGEGDAWALGWLDEATDGLSLAGAAEPAMPIAHDGGGWWFYRTVLPIRHGVSPWSASWTGQPPRGGENMGEAIPCKRPHCICGTWRPCLAHSSPPCHCSRRSALCLPCNTSCPPGRGSGA